MSEWWEAAPLASAADKPAAAPAQNWWAQAPLADEADEPPIDPALAKSVGALLTKDGQVRAQVRREVDADTARGVPKDGLARRLFQGATFNAGDEILAAGMTPFEMVKRGTLDPREAYAYAKAREDARLEDARAEGGITGHLGEALGGVLTGGGLTQAGVTAIPAAAARLGGTVGTAVGGAIDGAALGAVSGFMDGEDGNRLERAKHDAIIGGGVGGGLPLALAAAKPLVAPLASNIAARVNPQGYAERQVGRALERSGQSAEEVGDRLAAAAADGQGEYRLLDALDNPGARLASVVARNPGEGRTELRAFLNERQTGQAGRVVNHLAEGLDAPVAAETATTQMKAARRAADDAAFTQVRADANPVDVSGAVARIDETLRPGATGLANPADGLAHDSVEAVLAKARGLLTDGKSQLTGFEAVQRARGDVADAIGKAVRAGENNKARLLTGVRQELDAALEQASPSFRDAMAASRASALEINAVEKGRQAAGRGRTEPKIAAYDALAPGEQAAFRVGYADPLIARAQGGAEGVNAARPFTSQAARTELPAFAAPGEGEQMIRRLGREGEMFGNRAEALGGSRTADNLADNADAGLDAGFLMKVLGGHFVGATKDLLMRGAAAVNGNTEAVRAALAKLLMEGNRDAAVTMLLKLGQQSARRDQIAQGAFRGLLSGGLPTVNAALAQREPASRR